MKYYDEEVDAVISHLQSSENGLSAQEAKARLNRYGYNKLKETNKKSKLSKFIDQFKDMMIIILIIAAIFSGISAYLNNESYTETIVIVAVILINAIMGFAQEMKAEAAVASLKKMTTPSAKVIRDGKVTVCSSEEIVPGDIITLEAGDRVPADARVIWEVSSSIDESMLTGESEPIQKDVEVVKSDAQINERVNMIYSGCNVVYGKVNAVVVETGMNTELGKIASSVQRDKEVLSPLQIKINKISKALSMIIAVIIGIVLIYSILVGNQLLETIMLCISLAVAAIPEGLPAVITITLSIGTTTMAKKNTIVRKMSAVETLGSLDVICSDKTGTITQNKMTVKEVVFNSKSYSMLKEPIENSELLINTMVLCNDSKIDPENPEELIGDPTETALFKYAMDLGYKPQDMVNVNKRVAEVPFDSDRKMMTTVNQIGDKIVVCTKGSLDSIIEKCTSYYENGQIKEMNAAHKNKILKFEKDMAAKSLRNLAFSYKIISSVPDTQEEIEKLENDLTFIGLVGMMDPPRETVKESIKTCKEAGIKPVMITGDSLSTAVAIAKEIGIFEEGSEAIEGKELDKFSDEQLIKEVKKYSVYARVQPEHKVRIVKAWQANEKVVGMTGDGVNDAPAIKLAHVGIGMGKTGTEVTKSVADVILVDDSFSTIVDAVGEGRRIYDNIRNDIIYSLSSNFS
ncbi:MAG: HAD-IC family P-type ATPase, partial [Clostridia bacterium]|nr:HAD-IC family P-type ATPase [Clostridia bacterium]